MGPGSPGFASRPYYDAEGFSASDGRYSYTRGSLSAAKTGVDVSEHQGFIDWDAVAADGIDFAFIRVGYRGTTEGGLYRDACLDYNLAASREAGIDRGVYFFSQAVSVKEAREEAAFVLAALEGAHLEYPVAFDYELHAPGAATRIADVDSQEATAIARAFCEAIEQAGYDAMLYGNAYDLARFRMSELEEYPLWYAEYAPHPSYAHAFAIWQYGNGGQVGGIDTPVDLNLELARPSVSPE